MRSQIYLPQATRRHHKQQIDDFGWSYIERLQPTFEAIENEADEAARQYYDRSMSDAAIDERPDPWEIAETATEKGLERYQLLSLGEYTLAAAWHATLYEVFEQQLRLFLYTELSHYYELAFQNFCTDMDQIADVFKQHDSDPTRLASWPELVDLRLLCNVIKHSEGRSASELRARRPTLFRVHEEKPLLDLYRTTLLEITLNINTGTFKNYVKRIHEFWDALPERNYEIEKA